MHSADAHLQLDEKLVASAELVLAPVLELERRIGPDLPIPAVSCPSAVLRAHARIAGDYAAAGETVGAG